MGDKTEARPAKAAGVPILPGTDDPITTRAKAVKVAKGIGFPLSSRRPLAVVAAVARGTRP